MDLVASAIGNVVRIHELTFPSPTIDTAIF